MIAPTFLKQFFLIYYKETATIEWKEERPHTLGDDTMLIFALIIAVSIVMYIYYKVIILRMKDELTQKYTNAKARIFLGSFIFFFGVNQYIAYQTKLSLFVSLIFLILGAIQMVYGYKEAKHYRNEWRRLYPDA